MRKLEAENLLAEAERLGVAAHAQPYGKGVQVRFTGDHWHKTCASAALALLGEIPTPRM